MKRVLPITTGISILALTGLLFPLHPQNTFAKADHTVISEIQIGGSNGANDEFIELYNPTNSNVDMSGWSIQIQSISGVFSKKNITGSVIIPSHGYYLIAHSSYNGDVEADMSHSTFTLSSTGTTIFLVNNQQTLTAGNEISIVDKVSIGNSALNPETASYNNVPTNSTSIERKANFASTSITMGVGGLDEFLGNGEDTNNNSLDFVTRSAPQPQNAASASEPVSSSPTPSLEPSITPTPTDEPTPTDTPSPSPEPANTTIPTPSPSPLPTQEPTPTPTLELTITPIPTVEPSPSINPTVTPTPTKGPKIFARNPLMICSLNYRSYNIFGRSFYFPLISCYKTPR
jgi:hypothetical protein